MTDHSNTLILNVPVLTRAVGSLLRAITPTAQRRRTWEPARVQWNHRASILASLEPADRAAHSIARPYLVIHPEREIAEERNGAAYCAACDEHYLGDRFEWVRSPAFLRAQRWAHVHNAKRHPRRWQRAQQFPASIPAEIRERASA
ncbi:hypothetical protein LPW41_11735 [Microbacterium sp. JC 701]|uniref:hypothetical protein n=1 Tax=Microbacterium sp. JC 701 TaxID=2897389 RepID=UPI001E32C7BF|nr:hypothetical protein [Microbacterium sp. JC 701]MCD2170368.1 hypothetical protein [Microbacterium sp. JC 701]